MKLLEATFRHECLLELGTQSKMLKYVHAQRQKRSQKFMQSSIDVIEKPHVRITEGRRLMIDTTLRPNQ